MSEELPRLLVVEDVPVVQAFLAAALVDLPLVLDMAAGAGEALRLARSHAPALVLLDLNLPDGDGCGVLAALRAAGIACPAVALTADAQARLPGALAAAGFVEVVHKPLASTALRDLVGRWMPGPAGGEADVGGWEDGAALAAAGGSVEIVSALRGLLRRDLPAQLDRIASHTRDPVTARADLHRLQAAAAFCGAARLAAAARAMDARLQQGGDASDLLDALQAAANAVLAAPEPA